MNFLSHFYFDQSAKDPQFILGLVLPDLIKNAHKDWKIHPQKYEELFLADEAHMAILSGWKKHLSVDKYFHSSDFFLHHTHQIKELIQTWLIKSRVWPSFLAHISLELMLDSLLITENMVSVDDFYQQLEKIDRTKLKHFLELNQIPNPEIFFQFYDRFVDSKYLNSYRDSHQISYALNRICMRLWPQGLEQETQHKLNSSLIQYLVVLKSDFRSIFNQIELQLADSAKC